ncbi:Flagellar Member 3 [Trypanosoma brucei equiperdum]|uniref:Flagellar Member 3 n=1 Tax=Trypanosoma brucei equiperdum TaxID=630700 RepID=A0A3L6L2T6_9TRYP|nr:Flagellar Member 3 [Trypanosoma brucei equiperdum]
MKRRDEEKAKGPNEVNAEVIREAEAGLAKRVRAIVEERKAEEESLAAAYPFLGRTLKGIPLGELHLMSDPTFAELASHYTQDASNMDPAARAQQEKLLRDAADKIVSDLRSSRLRAAVRAEGLRERYPFLPEEPVRGVCLADVRPAQQQEFRDLSNELDELRRDPAGDAEAIAAMEEKMKALVTQLAEENATKTDAVHKQYPFLPKRVMGIPLGELPINDDAMFSQLGQRWLQQKSSSDGGKDAVATEEEMLQRVKDLARLARLAEKESEDANEYVRACNPFLLYEDRKCVLLSDIPLSKDDGYQKLFNEHLSALEDAEANAERLTELEEALRARADELALNESVRRALLNKCPFLASQDGLELSEKLLHDPVFQQQCARYDELMRDPVKNADALRQLEREMSLSMKSAAGGDPTASGSVGGAGALDGTSAAKGARTSSDGESFAGGLPGARGSVAAVVYPFLPETFLGVSQAELYLEDDPYFQELLARYNELVPDGRKPESPLEKQIYEQLCRRAGQIAGDVLKLQSAEQRAAARDASLYSFVDPSLLAEVPRDLTLEDDDEFCELMKRRDEEKAKGPNEVNAEVIREAEAGLAKRVRAIVEERKAEEESLAAAYPFLGRTLKGIPLGELHLMSDPTFAELASHYTQDASNMDPTARAQQEKLLRDAADKIVSDLRSSRLRAAVRAEGLRERYPFLPEEPVRGVCLADVRPAQQQEFRDLSNELDELRRDPAGDAEAIAAMEEKMKALVTQLAEENATKTDAVHKQYPFLPKRVMGIPLGELPINDDAMFSQLGQRWLQQKSSSDGGKDAVATEEEMLQRVKDLARLARLAEKESEDANEYVRACNPFLLYEDRKCVLLSDIPLSKDDGYQKLFNEHLSALEDAEANAERLTELEEALRARADELALNESVRRALLNKCPFLASQDGLELSEKLLHDPVFQQQCARYDELMRDPVKNADALRQLEREMSLSMKSAAGGDPTASGSVGGAGALDGTSAAKGARTSSDGESFAGGLPGARGSVAAVVYPFLPETFLGVSQAELYLEDDPYFQELLARYNELVPDGRKPESPLEKQIYEQLCRRAGQIAGDVLKLQSAEQRAAARDASLYSFVDPSLLAEVPRDLTLEDDDEFCELMKRRDEEKAKGPNEVNAEVIREAEAGLAKRVRAIVEERKAEEESLAAAYPFLGRTLKGIPLGELHLMSDPTFAELASHYTQDASNMDPTARAQQEKLLRDAADKIVSDLRSSRLRAAVRAEGLRERYPFLPEEPVRGVCLADVRPAQQQEFRDLSNELDELRRDPAGDAEAIAAMEEKMKALVTQLAEENATKTDAVHKQYPFLPKRVMGIPLGELPINDDAMFSQLGQRWLQQKSSSDGGKDAVATEEEMLQRVKDLARLARLAEKESEDANEYVRACNPFLLYEDRKCVLLSDIPLSKDDGYQKLFNEHLSALEDAEANAERLTELEEALRARADELALNESVRRALLNKCPFLASQDGLELSEKLLHDPVFQQQCARYDELMRDPVKNADALRQLEREMSLSMKSAAGGDPTASGSVGGAGALDGTSAAKGARTSSDGESFAGGLPGARGSVAAVVYPFLPETFLGVSQAELYLEDDPYFQELLARYNELVPDGRKPESPLEKQIYEQLCRRAGQIAGDVLKLQSAEQRAAARDASLYSFVDPSLLAEVPRDLTLEDDDEFCELMRDAMKRKRRDLTK